ncbi:MAG: protein prkA [Thermaerobacter sp.]|nr:protein prkA [Thermaerobacter sp.]
MSSEPLFAGAELLAEPLWTGTLAQYLAAVEADPNVAESAHHRLWRMVVARGEKTPNGSYPFFSEQIFGIDHALNMLVDDYLRPAAMGFDVKKRILLLVGPVGGGKSSIATLLKRGLEQFTRTETGALYGIAGCPMQEEPLHLIPPELRPELERRLGIVIAGDLCPWCRYYVLDRYRGQLAEVPVQRVTMSERRRIGIGTYAPSDPKSQDIADLIGSLDFQAITQVGSESDPRAYRFDGELNVANRGLIEFQEMLKLDEKFLYHLLSLSQEGNFKTGRYDLISADEVVIGHTNENEYRAFAKNPRNEALLSRMVVVPVPYNLDHRQEVRIYQKLLGPHFPPTLHVAPYALEVAAVLAIVSRVEDQLKPGGDRMSKLEAYSGTGDCASRAGLEHAGRMAGDGMRGLDPRYVLNRLASVLARSDQPCVGPLDVLSALKAGVANNPLADRVSQSLVEDGIQLARDWYNREIARQVLAAFAVDWGEQLQNLYENYIDNVVAAVAAPGNRRADERLLRAVEERLRVTETQTAAFREEIYLRLQMAQDRPTRFTYLDHPGLHAALTEKLFDDMRDEIKVTTQSPVADQRVLARIEQAVARMVETGSYCRHCANGAMAHVGGLLNR